MGVSVIGSGGVDKSLCLPFGTLTNGATFSPTTSYTTVYSGTGSGYLDLALYYAAGTAIGFMRVTIDGVIVFEGQMAGNVGFWGGMYNRLVAKHYYNGTSAYNNAVVSLFPAPILSIGSFSSSSVAAHPYTANAVVAQAVNVPNMDSFYFKNSLLIEMKSAVAGQPITYVLAGGKTP